MKERPELRREVIALHSEYTQNKMLDYAPEQQFLDRVMKLLVDLDDYVEELETEIEDGE